MPGYQLQGAQTEYFKEICMQEQAFLNEKPYFGFARRKEQANSPAGANAAAGNPQRGAGRYPRRAPYFKYR